MTSLPLNILVTGARAPVALHLARLFHFAGHRVVLADTPARPIAAASIACAAYRRLPPPRQAFPAYGEALGELLAGERIDLVVPTCEEVFYLAQTWRDRAMSAPLFAPPIELLARVHNKHDFIRLVERIGLPVPRTVLLQSHEEVQAMRAQAPDLVFKPVWSRFASHVLIRPEPQALDRIRPDVRAPWVAQDFVGGDEISVYALARSGRLKACSAYRSVYRAGKGAGVCFEPVADPAARSFVEAFVSATDWTGQISFDLVRTGQGAILPLECNPRATSGVHFFANPETFARAFLADGDEVSPDLAGMQGVRLAVWLYGLPRALGSGGIGTLRARLRAMSEVLDWPGDPGPRRAQIRALGEVVRTAVRQGISLQKASTHDIEWNGPDQSSIR